MGKRFTRSNQIKLQTILYICLFWALTSVVFAIINHFFLLSIHEYGFDRYSFWAGIFTNLLVIPLAGLLAGGMIVYVLREYFRNLPLWKVFVIDTLIIVLLIVIISLPGSLIYNSFYLNVPPWDPLVVIHSFDYFKSFGLLYTLIFWTIVAMITMVVLQVNDKYGPGIFLKMLKGKYHRPKVESRIFMFLDIRGSTAIAERLGHVKWFELLNDFFNDITEPILDTRGEIYQYVGDEIIVHWDTTKGLDNNQFLHCFFLIQKRMNELQSTYVSRYGVAPGFKAAIHCGSVTIGEIGKIKKEIVFSGDVLNTTARIQELCNVYGVTLLLSQEVVERMTDQTDFIIKPVGYIELRGKQTPVSIFAVALKEAGEPVVSNSAGELVTSENEPSPLFKS